MNQFIFAAFQRRKFLPTLPKTVTEVFISYFSSGTSKTTSNSAAGINRFNSLK